MRDFHLPGRSTVIAENGMAATSHPLASKVAIQMLEAGGNAVDAAIAAAMVLNVAEPKMTGLGGDCFALIKPAGSEDIIGLNASGRSPAGLDAAALRTAGHTEIPLRGVESVSVPGAVDGMVRLAKDHGRLGLKTLLAPAIHYAEQGIPVAPRVAFDWLEGPDILQGAARTYFLNHDKPFSEGQTFRAPGQAEVLRRIAMDGREGFYEGEVAEDMVTSLQALGGTHTLDDFAATACDYVTPIIGTYHGMELVELPPNGQGATAIVMANILENFDLASLDPYGTRRAHLEAEAAKLAYDARNRFVADPTDQALRLEHMLSKNTGKALADLINLERAMPNAHQAAGAVHKDTVYLTVIDRDRMAVSLIYSIFSGFGSGIASDKFGILFQNRASGFTLEEGHPNEAAGNKRPMHTIIPAMLRKDGKLLSTLGVMGGAYQPNGHVRILTNMVDYGMDPQTAIDAPRCFDEGALMKVERGYADKVRNDLTAMGHKVTVPDVPIGGAQMVMIDHENGVLRGASDPRKDGIALGY